MRNYANCKSITLYKYEKDFLWSYYCMLWPVVMQQ